MGSEQRMGNGLHGESSLPKDMRHSYEGFTQRPFYKEVNRKTLQLAPKENIVVLDIATGTGGIIDLMLEQDMIAEIWGHTFIKGLDVDLGALDEAKKKFNQHPRGPFEFKVGSSESIDEPDNDFDLVTFCNAIHLTDVQKSMKEAHRVLNLGGTFLVNSAFVDGLAYPTPEAAQLWRSLGSGAMKKAMRAGFRPERNTDFVIYKVEDYERFAKEAGFANVETGVIEAQMDKDDVLAICHYDEFAKGVLRGVPLDIAHQALKETAEEIFLRLENEGKEAVFPRYWMTLKAEKPV